MFIKVIYFLDVIKLGSLHGVVTKLVADILLLMPANFQIINNICNFNIQFPTQNTNSMGINMSFASSN